MTQLSKEQVEKLSLTRQLYYALWAKLHTLKPISKLDLSDWRARSVIYNISIIFILKEIF